MDYCGPRGIGLHTFLGWPASSRTAALAWSMDQRKRDAEKAVAQSKACRGCGTNPDDWTDDEGMPLRDKPFVGEIVECWGCVAVQDARDEIGKIGEGLPDPQRKELQQRYHPSLIRSRPTVAWPEAVG